MEDHPDLRAEQVWLDRANELLASMQERTAAAVEISDRVVRDENTIDARVSQWHLRRRERSLAAGSGPLCFGRIDEERGDQWYVGRRHVEDAEGTAVVVDWRAPVSAPFYRATAIDPCGLTHRRRFSVADGELLAIFDEDFSDPESASHAGLPDPLLAELDRSRTGQMRDIVATIAAEQDRIIRADLDELLVVQGGPGTGKTAVGLHRAAFLLFNHRRHLAERKVLVVGPNSLFLRYIADVLPSLGETSVVQTTGPGLLAARYRVRSTESDDAAAVKGDRRMAEVIDTLIRNRISVPAEGIEVRSGVNVVRFSHDDVEQLQKTALARALPVNESRNVFRELVIQEAWRRYSERAAADIGSQPAFTAAIRADPGFKKIVDRSWPALSAPSLIRDLLGSARRRSAASEGVLTADEQALIARSTASKVADERWTAADIPLLDEATTRTIGIPATYGHVVIDEAQDHSAMSLRMLGRRAERGSMTVLGDLAQATAPGALGSWDAAIVALGTDVAAQVTELTVGYRVPASVLDAANRLLPEAAPGITPARSVRPGGAPPLVVEVPESDRGAAVVAEVGAVWESTSSVAVVGIDAHLDEIEAALEAAGVPLDRVGGRGLPGAEAVALVAPDHVKGLEFDAVIVVEPQAIVDLDPGAAQRGLRRLYVSLTRSVQHLGVVHSRPLPRALRPDPQHPDQPPPGPSAPDRAG